MGDAVAYGDKEGTMTRWVKVITAIGAVAFLLTGCVAPPGYGYTQASVTVGGPQVAFAFSDGVQGYYDSAYGTYIYGDGGYYYRWVGNSWVYTSYYGGPWAPIGVGVFLPPLLIYGPPPPVVAYRPYFVWWRLHAAPWYQVNHPRWWYQHRLYVRHYALWHEHVVRFYENHPGQRPAMRPFFRRSGERFNRMPPQRQGRPYQQDRFRGRQPQGQFRGAPGRGGHPGPRRGHERDHRRPRRDAHRRDRREER